MYKKLLQSIIGKYCKEIREQDLELTLKELSEKSGIHYKTLYSFESGLSSNINILYKYYDRCSNKESFLLGLIDELERIQ